MMDDYGLSGYTIHPYGGKIMRDYFSDVKEYLNSHYKLTVKNEKRKFSYQ